MRPIAALTLSTLVVLGCSSGYQRAYEKETQRLETEAAGQRRQDVATPAEVSPDAAVVYFATGSVALSQDGQRALRWFVEKMSAYPQAAVLVQGFADSAGSEVGNRALSDERAAVVRTYLVSQGIDASRIQAEAVGTASPAAANLSAAGRRDNRRVEVTAR